MGQRKRRERKKAAAGDTSVIAGMKWWTFSCCVTQPEWTLFELAHAGLAGDKQQNTERRPNTIIRIIYKLANPVIIRYLKQSVPDEAKEQEKRLKALSPALTDLLRAEADCLLFKSTYEYIFVDVASEPSSSPLTLKMRPQPEDNG